MGGPRVTISKAALFARINRVLGHSGEQLRAVRSEPSRKDLGDYYVVSLKKGAVVKHHVNPVGVARQLGVLQPFEAVEGLPGRRS